MSNIVGKIVGISLMIAWAGAADASVSMKITDNQSRTLAQACIGQPFLIEVSLHGDAASQAVPEIEGLEAINGHRVGYHMKSINGVSSVSYTYRARVDQEGTYTIGPAHVGSYRAPAIDLLVTKEAKCAEKKDEKNDKAFFFFTVDRDEVVVGEKIGCTLRFIYSDGVTLKNIGQQEVAGFTQSAVRGPHATSEQIDGHTYHAIVWLWDLYPKAAGEFIIPAYNADYALERKKDRFWSHFGAFMQNHDLKSIYSQGKKIVVQPLDDAPYPVCAIGRNIDVHADLEPTTISQSEAVILNIDVTGEFSCQAPTLEQLSGMPPELKWYRSQTRVLEDGTMRNEFILQALKAGMYEIPAQQLCYFDVDRRSYRRIETQGLLLHVTPGHTQPVFIKPPEAKADLNAEESENVRADKSDSQLSLPLSRTLWNKQHGDLMMPWWLFFTLGMMTALYVVLKGTLKNLQRKPSKARQYKMAFIQARAAIRLAEKNKNPQKLYEIFVTLLAIRCDIPIVQITAERIDHELYNRFAADDLRAQWKQFFELLLECSFGTPSSQSIKNIFVTSVNWLETLQKIV